MNKFIDIIWNDANAILGVSRGSAAGFMINYLLEIVQVNPLKQPVELPHWRFIERNKIELPDVDVDIPSHKKEIVFSKARDYMESIGGSLVRVGTYKTETTKSIMPWNTLIILLFRSNNAPITVPILSITELIISARTGPNLSTNQFMTGFINSL